MKKHNYTYIAECSDGTFYTGWTTDIDKRIKAHNDGRVAKYTRSRLPVRLVYLETHDTKEEAMSRECQIKKLTRSAKEKLVENSRRPID